VVQLICLANSWRPGGRCVAGIERQTGAWVRPVPYGGGAIIEERTWLKGRFLAPLDVIDLDLGAPTYTTRFQRENRQVRNWNWRLVGQVQPAEVLKYCSQARQVLHGAGKAVDPSHMERLPPENWTSLELVRPAKVSFEPDPKKDRRWQARFSTGSVGPVYCLPVTDPVATWRLNGGEKLATECLLTVSLTGPIELSQHGKPELCYKLVAAVIELTGNA
jgi:hypothetical protein